MITDPLASINDDIDGIDLDDLHAGALLIYGSLSSIDCVKTTPEVFWSLFGTPNGKASAVKWLDSSIRKITEIKEGMPQ